MKKLILTFAFLLLPYSASAQTWLIVPKKTDSTVTGGTRTYPDLTGLPIPIARTQIYPVANANCPTKLQSAGCLMVQVREDYSKVGPTALSNWTKPTPSAVTNVLAAKGVDVTTIQPIPAPAVVGVGSWLEKIYRNFIAPALAWAGSGSDNFNRSPSNPISGSWTLTDNTANYSNPELFNATPGDTSTGQVRSDAACNGHAAAFFNAYTSASAHESTITIKATNTNWDDQAPGVRMSKESGDVADWYGVLTFGAQNYAEIDWHDDYNHFEVLAQDSIDTWAIGDVVKLRIDAGFNLIAYKNGTPVMTITDINSTWPTGQPGFIVNCGNDSGQSSVAIDDFVAADVTGAATVRHHQIIQ